MPDLTLIEHHPRRVLEAFRRGEFDQIEVIGQADEKEFFELCFKEKMLEALAEEMPTPRKKEEVPRWFILAANLSLKLHLENCFQGFERVVRCGGLLGALPPDLASKHLDPQTKAILLDCQGFNSKNHYTRATPCDHDTLRKFSKDLPAQRWMDWFNGPVQRVFQARGFFDPAGIFVGDGSYLFVPDNPAFEGSVVMWFDEHNHPVDYDKLTPGAQNRAPGALLQTGEFAPSARGLLRLCRAGGGARQCPRVSCALPVGRAIGAGGGQRGDQTAHLGSRFYRWEKH